MSEYINKEATFCWLDLATTDTVGAKKYYKEIFGWDIMDIPVGEGQVYTMLNLNGKPVAALSEMQEEQRKMNFPPYWSSYIAVDDINVTLDKVQANGGTVVVPPMEVMEEGLLAFATDPDGAYIGFWQKKNMQGFTYVGEHGSACWFEAGCKDRNKSIPFYENVLGWKSETRQMESVVYTTFVLGEGVVAGLYELGEQMKDVPSHWLPYFGISNIDTAVEKTMNLGGNVLMPKLHVKDVGYFAVLQDPQGAVFGVLEV